VGVQNRLEIVGLPVDLSSPLKLGIGETPLMHFIVASLALALVLAVVALVRQVQIRRALEALLRRLLKHWSSRNEE
jgi:hypothetical protein